MIGFFRHIYIFFSEKIIVLYKYRIFPALYCLVPSKEKRELLQYKDKEKGNRIFIIASGPSLNEESVKRLKNEKTIAVNGVIDIYDKLGFTPSYYNASDPHVISMYKPIIQRISPVFFSDIAVKSCVSNDDIKPVYYAGFIKNVTNKKMYSWSEKEMVIRKNIALHGVCANGIFIVATAIQLALFLGAREIVLVGCDCGRSKQGKFHYNDDGLPVYSTLDEENAAFKVFFSFIRVAKKYCNKNNVKLINATEGGNLELLDRKSISEIIGDLE